jgi:membrane associated rhomboid family serine protease
VGMTADPTVPRCAVHRDTGASRRCPRCQRPVCDTCLRDGDGETPCPACLSEIAGPSRGPQPRGWRTAPVTYGLLVAYVAVSVVGAISGGRVSPIVVFGAQINDAVLAGQWWRVLTATLLHDGLTHLAFNGYALYVLGPQLERGVGSAAFAALYVAAGLAGGMAFLVGAPGPVAVGASGAIFGLFGAYLAAAWANRDTPAGRAGLTQLGVLLAINLALPLLIPRIAWQAHVGGLLAGFAVGLVWAARAQRTDPGAIGGRVLPPAVLAAVLLAGLLWYI